MSTSFRGKTVLITGASRGIGEAIAVRLAEDGANVVVAAKTATPHPKLPGTIYTAAKRIEEAGGQALPVVCDIRMEDQVQAAVQKAVERFGGIDIVINNASAIWPRRVSETPMKRWDLMHSVNARGTYCVSQAALPHLQASARKGRNPHILNLSPPLDMQQKWFEPHTAYSISKYGMSMCALGMSGEFAEYGIAVNCLWPRTAIATAAMEFLAGKESFEQSRKPEIMADAAFFILRRDAKAFTGNFCVDDDVLESEGITDLDVYHHKPGNPLIPDFFVEQRPSKL